MNKRWRKANPETVAQDTESRQTPRTQKVDSQNKNTTQKTKNMSNTDLTNNWDEHR